MSKKSVFTGEVNPALEQSIRALIDSVDCVKPLPSIVQAGAGVLRVPTEQYNGQLSQETLEQLIVVMRETMLHAPGVGLAGPQIGIPLAIAVVEDHDFTDEDDAESSDVDTDADDAELYDESEESGSTTQSVGDCVSVVEEDNAAEQCDMLMLDITNDNTDDYELLQQHSDLVSVDEQGYLVDPRDIAEFPFHVIINPKYEPVGERQVSFFEGCLSFRGYQAVRKRWYSVRATWQDEYGESHSEILEGWPARIFQHETDHLHGELYIDQAEIRSLSADSALDRHQLWGMYPQLSAEKLQFHC